MRSSGAQRFGGARRAKRAPLRSDGVLGIIGLLESRRRA
jgi:hypothetical protein